MEVTHRPKSRDIAIISVVKTISELTEQYSLVVQRSLLPAFQEPDVLVFLHTLKVLVEESETLQVSAVWLNRAIKFACEVIDNSPGDFIPEEWAKELLE